MPAAGVLAAGSAAEVVAVDPAIRQSNRAKLNWVVLIIGFNSRDASSPNTAEHASARGTLRAGKGESQISQAQSRWKMETVPTIGSEEETAGNCSAGNEGKVNRTTDAANACHSFGEEEGGTAGAAGAEGEGVATQQAGVGHVVESHPVRQQPDFAMRIPLSGCELAAKMAWLARNTPSSSAVTVFAIREFIASRQSFYNLEPYAVCQMHPIEGRLSRIEGAFGAPSL